ncbi:MAG: peptide deformylase [Candidatus Omnitrophota bacterium]
MNKTELRIHTWPEKILRKKLKKVDEVDANIRQLLDAMVELMVAKNGIGLAGNQAGLDLRLVVLYHDERFFKLINPEIIKKEKKIMSPEGCLSFPGLEVEVPRFERVWVRALNENGDKVSYEAEGLLAIIFQHEIDHTNGLTFVDRLSFFNRLKKRKILKKIEAQTKSLLCDLYQGRT